MLKKWMAQTALAAGVLAVLAPAAMAAHRPDYGRGWRGDEVLKRAHRIDELAQYTAEVAERGRHHDTWREARAINRLNALAREADHFHHQVERYRERSQHTDGDFERLVAAYVRAADTMRQLHAFRDARAGFYELQQNMDSLMSVYRGNAYYTSRYGAIISYGGGDRDTDYDRSDPDRHDSDDDDHGDDYSDDDDRP